MGTRARWKWHPAPFTLLFCVALAVYLSRALPLDVFASDAVSGTCAEDEVTDNLGAVMVKRRLRIAGQSTEQALRTLLLAEYDAIKQKVRDNPHPSKVYIYAFDDCSRPPDMWLAMLSQNLHEKTPTTHVNDSMLKPPTSSIPATEVVGRWIHAHPFGGRTVTIHRKDGALWAEEVYVDGSRRDNKLVQEKSAGEDRLVLPGNKAGEYFVIAPDGALKEYDKDGLIYTLPKHP